ncbi:hypothetical protein [Azospirillum sp. sgz302134]
MTALRAQKQTDSVPVSSCGSAADIIRAFRTRRKETGRVWRMLDLDWPVGTDLARAAAEYVTDAVPGPRMPLLDHALCAALKRYDEDTGLDDDLRLRRMSHILFDELAGGLTALHVASPDGRRVWLPEHGLPLMGWLAEGGGTIQPRPPVDRRVIRRAIQSYAVPLPYRGMLMED